MQTDRWNSQPIGKCPVQVIRSYAPIDGALITSEYEHFGRYSGTATLLGRFPTLPVEPLLNVAVLVVHVVGRKSVGMSLRCGNPSCSPGRSVTLAPAVGGEHHCLVEGGAAEHTGDEACVEGVAGTTGYTAFTSIAR